jgi:hypothetical protein
MLSAVGYWIEDLWDEELPAPQELVAPGPRGDTDALVSYLDAGVLCAQYRGLSWCRFGCDAAPVDMGSCDLTDGTWVWPQGLSHYVSLHGVTLPEAFVVRALSGVRPQAPRSKQQHEREHDFSFWHGWSSQRRSPRLLQRLRDARQTAEVRAEEDVRRRAQEMEQEKGLADYRCRWEGESCVHRAIAGANLCARHALAQWSGPQFGPPDPLDPLFLAAIRGTE